MDYLHKQNEKKKICLQFNVVLVLKSLMVVPPAGRPGEGPRRCARVFRMEKAFGRKPRLLVF